MKLKFESRYKLIFFVDLSYILANLVYICSSVYWGYYFIGIVEILQILILMTLLIIEVKNVIKLKKIKLKNTIAIFILVLSIMIIGYSVIIWYFFIP